MNIGIAVLADQNTKHNKIEIEILCLKLAPGNGISLILFILL